MDFAGIQKELSLSYADFQLLNIGITLAN